MHTQKKKKMSEYISTENVKKILSKLSFIYDLMFAFFKTIKLIINTKVEIQTNKKSLK